MAIRPKHTGAPRDGAHPGVHAEAEEHAGAEGERAGGQADCQGTGQETEASGNAKAGRTEPCQEGTQHLA